MCETTTNSQTYQVFIVDDHPIVRRGVTQLINDETEMDVCGEADNVNDAFEQIHASEPDIVLVDISLRNSNGLDLVALLKRSMPGIPCLVVSMHDERLYAERALRVGARGYVMKQDGDDHIIAAIRKVLAGEVFVSESFNQHLLRSLAAGTGADFGHQLAELSERELEVFRALGEGKTYRDIADMLNVNVKTVETFRRRIKSKLGIQSSSSLTYRAIEWVMQQK